MAKKAYGRPQHRVSPLTVIIVVGIVFIFAALIAVSLPSDKAKIYNAYEASPNLQKDHVFETISVNNLIKVIDNKGPVMVYFGSPACSVCVQEIGYYDIEFKNQNVDEHLKVIYYVQAPLTEAQTQLLTSKYQMTLTGTPELYLLNNGAIVSKRADFNNSTWTQARQIREFMIAAFNHLD